MSKNVKMGCIIVVALVLVLGIGVYSFVKNSYNNMVNLSEEVKEKWSQVENVYQRRFDLIPNLVETVKGYASHERETLQAVVEARAKAGGTFNISDKVLSQPEMFQQFQQAQGALSNALSRLMVVVERYPELKADQSFLNLQNQLEGTENRITVERRRFNETAKKYNVYIKQFPRMILANMFGFTERPYFKATEGADTAPKVKF
jgi:LemA protein